MAFDAHKNFAVSAVATPPVPAVSGGSLGVVAGEGGRFPATPFNAVVWAASAQPTPANAEVVRVTAIAGDTLTITRTQEGSSARTIQAGDLIAAAITAKALTDLEGKFPIVNADIAVAAAIDGRKQQWNPGATPPGSPSDGDVWIYNAGAGRYWQLVYDSSEATYKWKFAGGGPLSTLIDTDETYTANGTWQNAPTAGPTVTVPRAGDYEYGFSVGNLYTTSAAVTSIIAGLSLNGADPVAQHLAYFTSTGASRFGSVTKLGVILALAAGDTLSMKYNAANGTAHTQYRALLVRPIRIS